MSLTPFYDFRRRLAAALVREIVGPSSPDEIINDPPITRYISGILFPRSGENLSPELDIDESDDDSETGTADPSVALANVRYPSSLGMSFSVDARSVPELLVEVSAARYEPLDPAAPREGAGSADSDPDDGDADDEDGDDEDGDPEDAADEIHDASDDRWRRLPLDIPPLTLDVSAPQAGLRIPLVDGLELFARIRTADAEGNAAVTLALLNTLTTPPGSLRDADSFFQPAIRVSAPQSPVPPFTERPQRRSALSDPDLRSYRLLYRNARNFAVGHGCSVTWTLAPASDVYAYGERALSIESAYTPEYPVPVAESNPEIKSDALSMAFLAQQPRERVLPELVAFADRYADWIRDRRNDVASLPADLRDIAGEHLDLCDEAQARMARGIELLRTDENVWLAFRFADSAMLQQRARSVWLRAGKPAGGPTLDAGYTWYPFQLAFILLCIEGIADPDSDDRNLVDLLWFPTGGGKTEAYLGLIAFTVFLRRLRNPDGRGAGVTALMRYTLRLLTIQQFERAALLICSCESIRRTEPRLGKEPISIGLWVGQGATPNHLDQARTAINNLRKNKLVNEGNPVQLQSCPWCGTRLDAHNYYIAKANPRLVITCGNHDCEFEKELPVHVVDQDIYRVRPTLLIATSDKFASLPWREEAADLFNLDTPNNTAQLPPELIVQDELHLISGPLGTLAGLYETVIDAVCTARNAPPKVVASTATIRRATPQSRGLFNRPVGQFPPPGLDAADSYFAVQAPPERRGNRLYLGLMAAGSSHTTLLVRSYAALLQYAQDLVAPDDIKDPYWTLVGYFNSLRVLGGARLQVQDDVVDRIRLVSALSGSQERDVDEVIELTSREPSSVIPEHLEHMAQKLGAKGKFIYPLDVILATNMISVGVDIDRLGLMAVMGQPQTTAEYIQSTSRVGRQYPGLVVVLYNAARSRDRSHYESFTAYHSALYRQVESTSVTPFSPRARDRGLHAVVVAMARLLLPEFRPNSGARSILTHRPQLEALVSRIIDRVRSVSPDEAATTEQHIGDILDAWAARAEAEPGLLFTKYDDVSKSLLVEASADDRGDALPTLWSLRDVDKESNLYLVA